MSPSHSPHARLRSPSPCGGGESENLAQTYKAAAAPGTCTADRRVQDLRAMVEDFRLLLIQMMEQAGRHLAHLVRERFLAGDPRGRSGVVRAGPAGRAMGGGPIRAAHRGPNGEAALPSLCGGCGSSYSSALGVGWGGPRRGSEIFMRRSGPGQRIKEVAANPASDSIGPARSWPVRAAWRRLRQAGPRPGAPARATGRFGTPLPPCAGRRRPDPPLRRAVRRGRPARRRAVHALAPDRCGATEWLTSGWRASARARRSSRPTGSPRPNASDRHTRQPS